MNKKGKTVKKKKKGKQVYQPLYVQSSNPSNTLLNWLDEMGETRIVYFQVGNPNNPPNCPPGGCT